MRNILLALCFLILPINALADEVYDEAVAMLNVMNAKQSYKVVARQMKKQLGIDSEAIVQKLSERIFHEMAVIYSQVYTKEELHGIRSFFESESGKAFLKKKPLLTEKYIGVLNKLSVEEMK